MGWFCCSSLCTNNHRTRRAGNTINYYRLPQDKKIQSEYKQLLKTDSITWKSGHICCEHWSYKCRKDTNDLPDICAPASQVSIFEEKYLRAKARLDMVQCPPDHLRNTAKTLQRR